MCINVDGTAEKKFVLKIPTGHANNEDTQEMQ